MKGEKIKEGAIGDKFVTVIKDKIIVDTRYMPRTGKWTTGVFRENIKKSWIIVDQYESKKEATKRHKEWVTALKESPHMDLRDIAIWGLNKEVSKK